MARSRATLLIVVALLLALFAGLSLLISGGPKIVIRPLLPYESRHLTDGSQIVVDLYCPTHVSDFLGHRFAVRSFTKARGFQAQRILLIVSPSMSISELAEALAVMRSAAEEDEGRTLIRFTYGD